jgi:hypothetical protein
MAGLTKVTAGLITANAVVDSFGTQSITGDKIGLTAINANNIVNSSITGDKIGLTAINANNIVNGTITTTQIASNTVSNTNIATGAIENYLNAAGLGFAMRNRIINGAMMIDQRNDGAAVTVTTGVYTLDRWRAYTNVASKFSVQQSSTAPTGFKNSTLITSLSAYSVAADDQMIFFQKIEGFNVSDLGFGTASASTVTLSFWVRSSLTGTFGGALRNSAANRSYPFSFTINSANTFEYKTVTVAGDTSGTWLTDSGVGLEVLFSLGTGSTASGTAGAWAASGAVSVTGAVSLVGTNGATFYITGVQLEKGSTATSFDYRPYGTELALCQRYCQIIAKDNEQAIPSGWYFSSSTELATDMRLTPPMRTVPTLTQTATAYRANSAGLNGNSTTAIVLGAIESTVNSARLSQAGYSGATAGQGAIVRIYNSGAGTYFGFTAEL